MNYLNKNILSLLTILALFLNLAAQNIDYSSPKEYEIGGITVEGTEYLDSKVLISISGLTIGEKIAIPSEDISKAIKKLWRQRLFTNVEIVLENTIETSGVAFLKIIVEERPRLSKYQINGVKNSEADEIRKKIKLKSGSIFTENMKINSVHLIKEYFIEKGFLNTGVDVEEVPEKGIDNTIMVVINVDKGQKVKVKKISIKGNDQFTNRKIKSQLKGTHEVLKFDLLKLLRIRKNLAKQGKRTSFLKAMGNISYPNAADYLNEHANLHFFKSTKFLKEDYQDDLDNIVAFYNAKGYRDAKIKQDSTYLISKDRMNIDITIDEGYIYYFGDIKWSGNTKFSDSTLNKILGIKKGDVFNQDELNAKLLGDPTGLDVSALYLDDGYLFFNVNPVEVSVNENFIDLEMRIYEGPQATINQIIISGNTKTNEHVIRRELRTLPGNKFSRSDLIRSQREIVNLGYFDPENLEVRPIPNPEDGTVDIEYRVTEKPSDQLELSAGWGGRGTGLVGTLGVSFTNFSLRNIFNTQAWQPLPSGDGQRLSIRVQSNGRVYQSYNLSFTEPWLGGKKPNSFTVSGFRTRFNDLDTENKVEGILLTTGASVGIGTRLKFPDDFFTFQSSINLQQYNLTNWNRSEFLFSDGDATNLSLRGTLARNSIDAPIYPKRGSNISLAVQATLPYSKIFSGRKNLDYTSNQLADAERYKWLEYHKWRFNAEWFTPLAGNLVFRASAKLGFLGAYNKEIGISPFERFELGGDGISNVQLYGRDIISLRGYNVITPSAGAPIFNKYSMEIRYPVSLNPSATIYLLGFLEGGNFWNKIEDYQPYDLKRSFGLGLRVFMPMFGLLGFDYGIGFDDIPDGGNSLFSKYGEFRIILGFEPE